MKRVKKRQPFNKSEVKRLKSQKYAPNAQLNGNGKNHFFGVSVVQSEL